MQVYSREELQVIADLCIKYDTLCISDEVYEWLVYTGNKHLKIGTDYSVESQVLVFVGIWGATDWKGSQNSFQIVFVMGTYLYEHLKMGCE